MKKKKNEKTENQKGRKKKHFWKESLCRGSIACFSLSVLSRSFRYDTSHATALAFKARVRLQLALGEKEARLRHKAVPFSLVFRICFFFSGRRRRLRLGAVDVSKHGQFQPGISAGLPARPHLPQR